MAKNISFGSITADKMFWGNVSVDKVYFGNILVWEASSTPTLQLPAPTIELNVNILDIYDNSEGLAESFNLYIDNAFVDNVFGDNVVNPVPNTFSISVDSSSYTAFQVSTDGENYTTVSKGGSEEFSTYNSSIYIQVQAATGTLHGACTYYVNNEQVYVWNTGVNSMIYEMNIENNASYTIKSTFVGGGAGN